MIQTRIDLDDDDTHHGTADDTEHLNDPASFYDVSPKLEDYPDLDSIALTEDLSIRPLGWTPLPSIIIPPVHESTHGDDGRFKSLPTLEGDFDDDDDKRSVIGKMIEDDEGLIAHSSIGGEQFVSLEGEEDDDVMLETVVSNAQSKSLTMPSPPERVSIGVPASADLMSESSIDLHVTPRSFVDPFISRRSSVEIQEPVLLFAIPRFKRTGELNSAWPDAEICFQDGSVEALEKLGGDPTTLDTIFMVPLRALDSIAQQLFYFRSPSTSDEDHPSVDEIFYSTEEWGTDSVIQRDGEAWTLQPGRNLWSQLAREVGVKLQLEHSSHIMESILIYWDEVTGLWSMKPFVLLDGEWVTHIPHVRRIIFVVKYKAHDLSSLPQYIRDEQGENFYVHRSGSYLVSPGCVRPWI